MKHGLITRGTKLTVTICRKRHKYYVICDPYKSYHVSRAVKFIVEQGVGVLNIAGPRERSRPGIYNQSKIFITDVLHFVFTFQRWGSKIWVPSNKKGKI
jgi:hypothetical protein